MTDLRRQIWHEPTCQTAGVVLLYCALQKLVTREKDESEALFKIQKYRWKNRNNDTDSSHTRCCYNQIYFRCTIMLWSPIAIKYDFLFHWFVWANGAKINVATNIGLRESVVRLIMHKCAFADNTPQLISSVCPSHTHTPAIPIKGTAVTLMNIMCKWSVS